MKRLIKNVIWMMTAVCLTGCGGQSENGPEPSGDAAVFSKSMETAQWPEKWLCRQQEETDGWQWGVAGFENEIVLVPGGVSLEQEITAEYGNVFYCLQTRNEMTETTYTLTAYDAVENKTQTVLVDLNGQLKLQDEKVYFTEMDADENGINLFLEVYAGSDEAVAYMVHLNSAMEPEAVTKLDGDEADGQEAAEYTVLGRLPDGRKVCQTIGEETQLFLLAGKKRTLVCEQPPEAMFKAAFRADAKVVYGAANGLYVWDVTSGSVEKIFASSSVNFVKCRGIFCLDAATVRLVFSDNEEVYSMLLSGDKQAEETTLVIENFLFDNQYLEACVDDYNMRHPELKIELQKTERDRTKAGERWNQALAEISVGAGPDLMLVDRTKLLALQDKGVLEDLSGLLSKQERETLLPGALQYGTIDGALYGLALSASIDAYLVADDVWQDATWTLSDVLDMIEKREQDGEPIERFASISYETSCGTMLYSLLGDLGHSEFLDLERGTCNFESEAFRRLLRCCKKYGKQQTSGRNFDTQEMAKELQEKRALAFRLDEDFIRFGQDFASLGEGYHAVGYPSENGTGVLLNCYQGCVAVNQASRNKKEYLDDFLRFLVSYRAQKEYGLEWIRTDVLRDNVREGVVIDGQKNPVPVFQKNDKGGILLAGKPDGTSYLEEYLELLLRACPNDDSLNVIWEILWEETPAYFEGNKSEREVARMLQNRVTLYLAEAFS